MTTDSDRLQHAVETLTRIRDTARDMREAIELARDGLQELHETYQRKPLDIDEPIEDPLATARDMIAHPEDYDLHPGADG